MSYITSALIIYRACWMMHHIRKCTCELAAIASVQPKRSPSNAHDIRVRRRIRLASLHAIYACARDAHESNENNDLRTCLNE